MPIIRRFRKEFKILSDYSSGNGDSDYFLQLYNAVELCIDQRESLANLTPRHFMKLVYFKNSPDIPLGTLDFWRILGIVSRTRGLSRWLSFNCFSSNISVLKNSYLLSRINFFRAINHHRYLIREEINAHLRLVIAPLNFENVPTITQNDYFRAISGTKIEMPNVSILFTQGKFQFNRKGQRIKKKQVPTLISLLMAHDAKTLLHLLLEFGVTKKMRVYLQIAFPDALKYIDSLSLIQISQMKNSDKTFDQIAEGQNWQLKGDLLERVEIWHQRFLIKESNLFEFDTAGSSQLSFVAGHWQYMVKLKTHATKVFIVRPVLEEKSIPEAIFLSDRADENWFHLLLDTLPRYLFLKNLPSDIPVLIRGDLPVTTREFLFQILGRPVIELNSNSKVYVEKLHLLAARSTCFDSMPKELVEQASFSPMIIEKLVHWTQKSMKETSLLSSEDFIYFRRNSRQRRILNQSNLEKVVRSKKLKVFDDNVDLYRNQVAIFSKLKLAVCPGGAMLANMIFMKPGSYVLCLRSWRQNDLYLWKKLAEAVGLNYLEVTGPCSSYSRNTLQRMHSNYFISPRKFRKILSVVMRSST